ncbi:amino acid adenylation domain-containing protein [Psychromonas sp. SP041]|uniref:amino acid adenylation domain-containing protein n=1 Tax=Psychromonas sp. SP041 TaxID=1365007 RepID=UPI0010C7AC41|nr:amino acid adenylation domain-containing protein [Psychromonas sp. SP041]
MRTKNKAGIVSMFMDQYQSNPNRIILKNNSVELTYKDIALGAESLSRVINELTSNKGKYIGIYTDQDQSMYFGVFGALFSGNGYVPLSPEYPDNRVEHMISDSDIKIIFTKQKYVNKLQGFIDENTVIVINEELVSKKITKNNFLTDIYSHDDAPAYMIYTSGSTGVPKGVPISNKNITNQMEWLSETLSINEEKTILQKTPISFDAAQWEILSVCCGTTVIIGDSDLYKNPNKIISNIKMHGITSIQCVPTLLKALLSCDEFNSCNTLTEIYCGGEALTKKLALDFKEKMPGRKLINLYGPTECTINATYLNVNLNELDDYPDVIPIGLAVKNTEIFIINDSNKIALDKEVGEICITGSQVSSGYHNNSKSTADKFICNELGNIIYHTGDLGYKDPFGNINFVSRKDNQVKVRGYRVELDEVKVSIENHDWVKNAGVILTKNQRTEFEELTAYIELNPREAALMDQGLDQSHHISKSSKTQVLAQLSNAGVRCFPIDEIKIDLPCKQENVDQSKKAFARKTYRTFKGKDICSIDLINLISADTKNIERSKFNNSIEDVGHIMRMFGQFRSKTRLLPKYSYASPGALYAVQLYIGLTGITGIDDGTYYYNPINHTFTLVGKSNSEYKLEVHLIGITTAISSVYKNNVIEVLEMEAGHIIGMFDDTLKKYNMHIQELRQTALLPKGILQDADSLHIASFNLKEGENHSKNSPVELYLQNNNSKIPDMKSGIYKLDENEIKIISDKTIRKKDVIAINQSVYDESHFAICMVIRDEDKWDSYIWLGRELQKIQLNNLGFGLMSSGYSSKTGNDLLASTRLKEILGERNEKLGALYVAIGGPISEEQILSQGMDEDLIHSRGPTEILKDDLKRTLPTHMIPNNISILHEIPQTPNGKVDNKELKLIWEKSSNLGNLIVIEPKTKLQKELAILWASTLDYCDVSIDDEFFTSGGNSLTGVMLISKINEVMELSLPLQILFDGCTIKKIEDHIINNKDIEATRVIHLNSISSDKKIFCWPGLGGYPMGLKNLAESVNSSFYGIQSYGINLGEVPYSTIKEMATADIKAIKEIQKTGPYYLWGYSFGAKVAFETAYQLEQNGDTVKHLAMIAPGSPKIYTPHCNVVELTSYKNIKFVTILFSVFFRCISGDELDLCISLVSSKETFIEFIKSRIPEIDTGTIERIVSIVEETYDFKYTFKELQTRSIKAAISILKSIGDDYSFIDGSNNYCSVKPDIFSLTHDHYQALSKEGSKEISMFIEPLNPTNTIKTKAS